MSSRKRIARPSILSGWKDIANHLGKGVRTVQRYEVDLGLPIRRPAGGVRGSVIATTMELDAWVNVSPLRGSFALRREPSENSATLADFRKVLAEHHRLREEMARFRAEMHIAVELLRNNLGLIQARNGDQPTSRSGIILPFENGKLRLN